MQQRAPAELVRACRRGDPAAWDELLERYGRLIWSVTRRMGLRRDEAEEIFQRSWLAILEGIGELREPERLASWIFGIARNQTYQLFAQARQRRAMASLDHACDQDDPRAPTPSAEAELERLQTLAALGDAMEALDPRCRRLLDLLFLREPSPDYREISRLTGLAVGSIGPIRARCLGKLRKIFERMYQNAID